MNKKKADSVRINTVCPECGHKFTPDVEDGTFPKCEFCGYQFQTYRELMELSSGLNPTEEDCETIYRIRLHSQSVIASRLLIFENFVGGGSKDLREETLKNGDKTYEVSYFGDYGKPGKGRMFDNAGEAFGFYLTVTRQTWELSYCNA